MRVTAPDAVPEAPGRLSAFLAAGHHAGMDWMAARAGERADPSVLWPEVRSIVMLGLGYGPDLDPRAALGDTHRRRDLGLCPRRPATTTSSRRS